MVDKEASGFFEPDTKQKKQPTPTTGKDRYYRSLEEETGEGDDTEQNLNAFGEIAEQIGKTLNMSLMDQAVKPNKSLIENVVLNTQNAVAYAAFRANKLLMINAGAAKDAYSRESYLRSSLQKLKNSFYRGGDNDLTYATKVAQDMAMGMKRAGFLKGVFGGQIGTLLQAVQQSDILLNNISGLREKWKKASAELEAIKSTKSYKEDVMPELKELQG